MPELDPGGKTIERRDQTCAFFKKCLEDREHFIRFQAEQTSTMKEAVKQIAQIGTEVRANNEKAWIEIGKIHEKIIQESQTRAEVLSDEVKIRIREHEQIRKEMAVGDEEIRGDIKFMNGKAIGMSAVVALLISLLGLWIKFYKG